MKILYNITVIVDDSVTEDWKRWMIDVHIPDVMATGAFETYQMQKVLREEYERYQMQHAPRLQEDHTKRYQGKFGAFRTLMEVISAG